MKTSSNNLDGYGLTVQQINESGKTIQEINDLQLTVNEINQYHTKTMDAPGSLSVSQPLLEGYTARITWNPVPDADGYILERRFDRRFDDHAPGLRWSDAKAMGFKWKDLRQFTYNNVKAIVPAFDSIIYQGAATSYVDTMQPGARYVIYRVMAFRRNKLTWNQAKERYGTWENWRNARWRFWAASSGYTESNFLPITANRPPVISGVNQDLGFQYKNFPLVFSVYDPEPQDTVNVTVRLGTSILASYNNITQNREYTVTIDPSQYGGTSTITITATDNRGLSAQRIYTFRSPSENAKSLRYYIYRDGVPVDVVEGYFEWDEYIAVGTHNYFVRTVTAYGVISDSNVVTMTAEVGYSTLALASNPSDFVELKLKYQQDRQIAFSRNYGMEPVYYLGQSLPKFQLTGEQSDDATISYTITTQEQWRRLHTMLERREAMVYRYKKYRYLFCTIPEFPEDIVGHFPQESFDMVVDITLTLRGCAYEEEVDLSV